ncbi:ABC transporter permease [Chloroflexus sp.]|uniref:ABC transporter permease n=1 Tax=Chloroflexus sp. TaxID=1904827 RepID=UPI004049E124
MLRYLRLFVLFVHNNLQIALEYRVNFLTSLFQSVLWLLWGVLGTLVFFQFTGTLGGWTLPQALLVVGMFRIFEGLIDGIMRPNITRIVEHIQKGTLDFVLVKPVDSQFMASLRQINLMVLPDFLVGFGLIIYGLWLGQIWPTPFQLLAFLFLLACGMVIAYAIWMLLVTTAFWLVQVENVTELLTAIYETGRFPVTAYSQWLRLVLTFVIPIAFLTTFPAAALIGLLAPFYLLLAPIIAGILLLASRAFWRVGLRSYTSASS